jgi:biopolymer transport protein ExbD
MNTLQDTSGQNKPKQIKRTGLHIDMTPMVDVAMLLLTFFMLTTVFSKPQAMELIMPKSQDPSPVPANKLITLFVDRYSQIFTQNGDSDDILPLPLYRLRNELSNLKKESLISLL